MLAGVLTAVGTAFDVRTTYNRVRVAVTDGTVQVDGASTETAATPPAARLRPGEAMSFVGTPGHSLESARVLHVDPTEQTRWREGWLVYRDEPLQEVLADVSRYVNSDIIVSPALATDVHFTGVVNKDSIVEWLKSLPNAFPVKRQSRRNASARFCCRSDPSEENFLNCIAAFAMSRVLSTGETCDERLP